MKRMIWMGLAGAGLLLLCGQGCKLGVGPYEAHIEPIGQMWFRSSGTTGEPFKAQTRPTTNAIEPSCVGTNCTR